MFPYRQETSAELVQPLANPSLPYKRSHEEVLRLLVVKVFDFGEDFMSAGKHKTVADALDFHLNEYHQYSLHLVFNLVIKSQ